MSKISFFFLMIVGFSNSLQAQLTRLETIPEHSDVISINIPEGFHYEFGRGLFKKFLYEYVPEGQTKDNWTQILSLGAVGNNVPKSALMEYSNQFFDGFRSSCEKLNVEAEGQRKDVSYVSADFKVICETKAEAREKVAYLKPIEIGYYRILISENATYEFHSLWHGTKDEAQTEFFDNVDGFWQRAAAQLNSVTICDVKASNNCPFDRDMLNRDVKPVANGGLRCRQDSAVSCYSSAMIALTPRDKTRINPNEKNGLIILQMDREDLTQVNLASFILQKSKESFDAGMPAMLVIIKPSGDPNHEVTREERAIAATFSTFIGEIGTHQKLVDTYSMTFMNFQ